MVPAFDWSVIHKLTLQPWRGEALLKLAQKTNIFISAIHAREGSTAFAFTKEALRWATIIRRWFSSKPNPVYIFLTKIYYSTGHYKWIT